MLLTAHIVLGFCGVVLGPLAMLSRKRPGFHPRIGEVYHWVMLGLCLSAAALAVADWGRLRMFLPIAGSRRAKRQNYTIPANIPRVRDVSAKL